MMVVGRIAPHKTFCESGKQKKKLPQRLACRSGVFKPTLYFPGSILWQTAALFVLDGPYILIQFLDAVSSVFLFPLLRWNHEYTYMYTKMSVYFWRAVGPRFSLLSSSRIIDLIKIDMNAPQNYAY